MNTRAVIAHIIDSVANIGMNLDDAFAKYLPKAEPQQHAFIKAASFGAIRYYPQLHYLLNTHLLDKPLKAKASLVEALFISGLHECLYMHTPQHACVSENVHAVSKLKATWAKGLFNAILRRTLRERDAFMIKIQQHIPAHYAHPKWLIDKIQQYYPQSTDNILQANNQPGPLTLRVNRQKTTVQDYLALLSEQNMPAQRTGYSDVGIRLEQAVDISQLPHFDDGWVSVQDEAAQLATTLLNPQAGESILDACAAPGGKTGHLLEYQPDIHLVALDSSQPRLNKVAQNLSRLELDATLIQGDASQPDSWWDQQPFDRILLDAPCSATGVIRRHPDIKLLRQANDLPQLTKTQSQMLIALWPLLKTGGMLLYATCSVLAEENAQQIQHFISNHPDAMVHTIEADWGTAQAHGRQILPGDAHMDGFYYAAIYKCE